VNVSAKAILEHVDIRKEARTAEVELKAILVRAVGL